MRKLQRAAGLLHDAQRARQWKAMAVVEQGLQTLSLNQLHGDVVEPVFFACVENHHDVGMGQQTSGARFRLESRQEFGARESRAFFAQPDSLDRDGASDHRIHGLVNDAHGAAAQFTDDFVSSGFCYCWHHSIDLPLSAASTGLTNTTRANRVSPIREGNLTALPVPSASISWSTRGNASADTRA